MISIRAFLKNSFGSSNLLSGCKCGYIEDNKGIFNLFSRSFNETKRDVVKSETDMIEEPATKILKIAIIGTPNVGKSTFINQIVGRRVCAISKKVHTTRVNARAVINLNDTQVVFLDTPGLVSQTETNKHSLEHTFLRDGESAMIESNVVGVIHDVSNRFTRGKLDPKVLRLLHLYPWKHSVLILNKVDTVKKKGYLLELADRLTCKTLVDPGANKSKYSPKLTEEDIFKKVNSESGWPNFSQVFMVSALEGLGVVEVMEYLMQFAKPGHWMFSDSKFTDQKPEKVIVDTVKAKLLDKLPDEIPYNVKVQLELYNELRDGTIMAVVLITCPTIRSERMVIKQVRRLAQDVEAELRSVFLTQVLVKLAVQAADKK